MGKGGSLYDALFLLSDMFGLLTKDFKVLSILQTRQSVSSVSVACSASSWRLPQLALISVQNYNRNLVFLSGISIFL